MKPLPANSRQEGGQAAVDLWMGENTHGWGTSARFKKSSELTQWALGANGYFVLSSQRYDFLPFARAGLHLVQLDILNQRTVFGAFSPHAELGLLFRVWPVAQGMSPVISVSALAEYNVRFGAPGSTYFAFLVGFGFFGRPRTELPSTEAAP